MSTTETPRRCRQCGCTDDNACLVDAGFVAAHGGLHEPDQQPTCWWVQPDLCSGCAYGITVRGPVQEVARG